MKTAVEYLSKAEGKKKDVIKATLDKIEGEVTKDKLVEALSKNWFKSYKVRQLLSSEEEPELKKDEPQ